MRRFEFIDGEVTRRITDWVDRVAGRIRVEMHNQGINASGNLSESVEGVVTDGEVMILAAPYFIYAEKGRDKGGGPYDFSNILKKWISDKGLSVNDRDDSRFAYFIARKIKAYGSARFRDANKRVDLVGDVIDKELPELNDIIENRLVLYVNDSLFT